jgi:hypothetical protein
MSVGDVGATTGAQRPPNVRTSASAWLGEVETVQDGQTRRQKRKGTPVVRRGRKANGTQQWVGRVTEKQGDHPMNIRKLLGAAALVGVVAAGGSAFTASNSLPAADAVKGYGSQTISGVTASTVNYNTNTAGDTITSIDLVLVGDTTAKTIKIAFNDSAPATCSGTGIFTTTTAYNCVVSQSVGTATKFALVAV